MKKLILLTIFMLGLTINEVNSEPITFRSTFTTETIDVDIVLPLDQIRELRGKLARSLSVENFVDGFLTAFNLFVWLD